MTSAFSTRYALNLYDALLKHPDHVINTLGGLLWNPSQHAGHQDPSGPHWASCESHLDRQQYCEGLKAGSQDCRVIC